MIRWDDMVDGRGPRKGRAWRRPLIALAVFVAASGYSLAATTTRPFTLTVNLENHASCSREVSRVSGVTQVTLACSRNAERPNDRFLLHVYRAGEWLGVVDGDMGNGTITSWRVVRVANRDYLEIMVGW